MVPVLMSVVETVRSKWLLDGQGIFSKSELHASRRSLKLFFVDLFSPLSQVSFLGWRIRVRRWEVISISQ
jgi:hypothetical protein